jgi:hypothetical protein
MGVTTTAPQLAAMRADLLRDFAFAIQWLQASRATPGTIPSSPLRGQAMRVSADFLVTHPWRMPRAYLEAECVGLQMRPAAVSRPHGRLKSQMPYAICLAVSWLTGVGRPYDDEGNAVMPLERGVRI